MRLLLFLILWLLAAPAWAGFKESVDCAQMPALTGDTTTSIGSCATSSVWHKVSTQVVSAGASIAFTGLATYNNYKFVCTGVFPSTNATDLAIQVGEGATPTWETSSYKYFRLNGGSGAATVSGSNSASATSLLITAGAFNSAATGGHDLVISLWDVLSTTKVKNMFYYGDYYDGTNANYKTGSGAYTGDTNVVTAWRIIPSSGNVNGTCTAYGMVQ